MAFNPSPSVAEARDIATKHGDDMVIVLRINLSTDLLQSASYGRTKPLCNVAGQLSDAIVNHLGVLLEEVEERLQQEQGEGE